MKFTLSAAAAAALLLASPALAAGDVAKGEKAFKQCQTCHVVVAPDGTVLAGRKMKTGPNLYGVFGRVAGTYPDFAYGPDMVAAGAKGLVWDEAQFTAYTADPSKFLQAYLGDPKAKGKMAFKVKTEAEAADLYAYLTSLFPAPAAAPVDPAAAPVDPAAAPAPSN
ncbi:c-type cytochrome [Rhodobacter ferrooxidans]|uniref:Cytochrome c class I n=1 Tax=Rhodobacter ferrooxidans TaxID=371731 RepID=C8RYL8_9RHOB|nr:c-type cytochrome [Rhodobacter sp. SW2]EEW26206.1 cytochrome c class I [Rhodobacter sp. SW2]